MKFQLTLKSLTFNDPQRSKSGTSELADLGLTSQGQLWS